MRGPLAQRVQALRTALWVACLLQGLPEQLLGTFDVCIGVLAELVCLLAQQRLVLASV